MIITAFISKWVSEWLRKTIRSTATGHIKKKKVRFLCHPCVSCGLSQSGHPYENCLDPPLPIISPGWITTPNELEELHNRSKDCTHIKLMRIACLPHIPRMFSMFASRLCGPLNQCPVRELRLRTMLFNVMTRAAVGGYSDDMLPPMLLAIFYKLHL